MSLLVHITTHSPLAETIIILSNGMHFVSSSSLPLIEGIIVFLLTAVNLALCAREERLRRTEMVRSVQDLLSNCDGKEQAQVEDLNIIFIP